MNGPSIKVPRDKKPRTVVKSSPKQCDTRKSPQDLARVHRRLLHGKHSNRRTQRSGHWKCNPARHVQVSKSVQHMFNDKVSSWQQDVIRCIALFHVENYAELSIASKSTKCHAQISTHASSLHPRGKEDKARQIYYIHMTQKYRYDKKSKRWTNSENF